MEGRRVKIKDYDPDIHAMKVLLHMVGIQVDYEVVHLMHKAMTEVEENGDAKDFTIADGVRLQLEAEMHWDTYYENQKTTDDEKL
jgi:hypothetical protein